MSHILELRTRFFLIAVVFVITSTAAYVFRDHILHLLLSPLHGQKLIYLNPAGGFSFVFLVSMYVGLAFTAPFLISQLYAFARPALPVKVQQYAGRIFISSMVLLISGMAFGYVFAIPGAMRFLYGFASSYVVASLTADSYLNFVIAYTAGLGLVFQLPLILLFIHWIRPFTPGGLLKSERWLFVLAFVAAAIITPTPDPLNQTIIALPIIVVYQIGVVAVLISIRRSKKALNNVIQPPTAAKVAKVLVTKPQPSPLTTKPLNALSVDGFKTAAAAPRRAAVPVAVRRDIAPVRPRQTSMLQTNARVRLSLDGFV